MKLLPIISFVFVVLLAQSPFAEAVSRQCGEFSMNLEGSDTQKQLGRRLYKELYEGLEELSLEAKKVKVCSFSCSPVREEAVQCDLHLKIEYDYIPLVGEFDGVVYCEESYLFNGESNYQTLSEECDLTEFPILEE